MTDDWLVPQLSLAKQLSQEIDRRMAAKLNRYDLSILSDKLICDWYKQTEAIQRLIKQVQQLQVKLALAEAEPFKAEPSPEHLQWARELLQ
jgi:hypothetical protein